MSNKKDGNDFESEFCQDLAAHGFWAHNMANRKNGQPADVIAVKRGRGYLIDCKVCADNTFRLSRIEPNQHSAMHRWMECGNDPSSALFALKISDGVYLLPYEILAFYISKGTKQINAETIKNQGTLFDMWASWEGRKR